MQRSDKASPRQSRQLSFIAQYSTSIEYMPGGDNAVADSLSRMRSIRLPTEISFVELADQENDEEFKKLRESPGFGSKWKPI